MSIIHPHFQDYWDNSPVELALWWYYNSELFLRCLTQSKYHKPFGQNTVTGNLLIYPPKCNIKDGQMNGRKSKQPVARFSDSDGKPSTLQWINISLTDKDIAILESETGDLEQLAFAYISLGMLGLGLSVKYDSARKSYNVCIYGPDMAANMQSCGVSGAAPDLRDALLVSLYKFNSRLQGSFDGQSVKNAAIQPRRFG